MKKIISCLLTLFMLLSYGIIVNADDSAREEQTRWNSSIHQTIISACVQNGYIPSNYENLVKVTSNRCDSLWSDYKAFHGFGNYVATQKFLWKYCRLIVQYNPNNNGTMLQYAQQVATTVRNTLPTSVGTTTEQGYFDNMVNKVPLIINAYYQIPNQNSTHTIQKRCKYITIGLLAHFYGDITAHRIILPTTAVNNLTNPINTSTMLDKSHFKNNVENNWDTLVTDVNAQTVTFHQLKLYMTQETLNALANGDFDNGTPHGPDYLYADRADFYSTRVNLAQRYLTLFLTNLSNGYQGEIIICDKGNYSNYTIEKYSVYYTNVEG